MAALKIVLVASGSQKILLSGEHDGTTFTVTKLHLPDRVGPASVFDLSEPLTGLLEWLGAPSGDEYPLRASLPQAVLLRTTWEYTAGTKVFGKVFRADAAIETQLEVFIPLTGSGAVTRVLVGVCGRLSLDAGGTTFASEPLCYEIEFPLGATPRLSIGLPDMGLRIPRLDLPWSFPSELPLSLPLTIPAWSFDFPPLAGRVSFRAISVSLTDTELTLDVRGFRIEALQQALEADIKLVVKDEKIDPAKSTIRVIRPDLGNPFGNFPQWYFDDDCLILAGDQRQLNELLSWLTPECDELRLEGDVPWTIRLRRDGDSLEELRIDLQPATEQRLGLPGFDLTVPVGSVFHLVFRQPENEPRSFWAGTTIKTGASATVSLPFTWDRPELTARERLKSDAGSGSSSKGLSLKATLKKDLTLAIARFQDGVRPEFFRRTEAPLAKLDIASPAASCPATADAFHDLESTDVDLPLDGSLLKDFTFPFLRDELSEIKQVLQVTNVSPPAVDFGAKSIGLTLTLQVKIGPDLADPALSLIGDVMVKFFWETLAFRVDHEQGLGLKLPGDLRDRELFGLKWDFHAAPADKPDFQLLTKNSNYQIKQAPGTRFVLKFDRATRPDQPIQFEVTNFCLSPGGISLDAAVLNSPAKLNALDTEFRFTEGIIQIRDNRIAGFTLGGSGPLPPALVGPAMAAIRLQFTQDADFRVRLVSADARIQGDSLLKCESTRFQFAVTALGLKFVEEDGRYHLYFTISGTARFVLAAGDGNQGPLGWLPAVELQMVECPLTTDVSALARHINFLIPLPKPQTFSFLGCFEFELRAIGYAPQDTVFREPTPAMLISGQIKFSADADAIDARVDFHNLHIGLPKAGKFFPQLYLKGLGLKLAVGSAFELSGSVEFLDEGTDLQGGVTGEGFFGRGDVQIQGLPRITAGFAFLRVRRNPQDTPARAWFLYLEANRSSLEFPVIRMFLREVGIGFGYRFTLAMIKSVDEVNDPRQLLKVLKEQAKRAGELSQFAAWRVDLEEPGEDPRWTIALRAMIAQNSAATSPTTWTPEKEEFLPNLFLIDAVLALRSDLTFLMVARAWFLTNYYDFTMEKPPALRQQPLLTGFILLSPRKKRLLANLSSNPDAVFGEHSPVPDIVKLAIRGAKFSATLLVEPGLVHYELGWPNQLRWEQNFGDVLKLQFCGGMIYRLSKSEFVIGQSFLARGELKFQAGVDFGFVGAKLKATAMVAYGARYIGVLAFPPHLTDGSAFYGGAGIEIHVSVSVEFWIEIDLLFGSITLSFDFSFAVNFTASVEIGVLLDNLPGVRGTATLGLCVMGHDLHFGIRVALNEGAVQTAFDRTEQFLHVGLEAGEVESIPGTQPAPTALMVPPTDGGFNLTAAVEESLAAVTSAVDVHDVTPMLASVKDAGDAFETPSYRVLMATVGRYAYFALIPAAELLDDGRIANRPSHRERGFLPVPPINANTVYDFELQWTLPAGVTVSQVDAANQGQPGAFSRNVPSGDHGWKVEKWTDTIPFNKLTAKADGGSYPIGSHPREADDKPVKLQHWLGLAYLFENGGPFQEIRDWEHIRPIGDPAPLFDVEDDVTDQRVHDPSDDAFEAAVRGAVEQFKSSPYLRRSKGEYDVTLRQAFDPQNTIYSPNRTAAEPVNPRQSPAHQKAQQVFQTRSVILRGLISDFQRHVAAVRSDTDNGQTRPFVAPDSLACRFGLVFRADLSEEAKRPERLANLVDQLNRAELKQRTKRNELNPTASAQRLKVFNPPQHGFDVTPPTLDRLVHHTHEGSVGLDWSLTWKHQRPRATAQAFLGEGATANQLDRIVVRPGNGGYQPAKPPAVVIHAQNDGVTTPAQAHVDHQKIASVTGELAADAIVLDVAGAGYTVPPLIEIAAPCGNAEANPEQHLDHYLIRRKWLDGSCGDREFRVKPADVLHLDSSDPTKPRLKRLRPRFQFIDHFDDEPADFLASLPPEGRRYAYTIVPIDVTGVPSSRPKTVIVRRLPASPPPVVPQSELIVDYSWPELKPHVLPRLWPVRQLSFLWTPPVDPEVGPRVAVAGLRLVFRRDEVLALGQYAQDSDVGGPLSDGLPTSNARPLRTDETFEFDMSDKDIHELVDLETRQRRYSLMLNRPSSVADLVSKLGVEFNDSTQPASEWRPLAWRAYVQTKSAAGVYSALVPVDLRLRFNAGTEARPLQDSAAEERRPGTLEWLSLPVIPAMLPPRDQTGTAGFAQVPMPPMNSITDLSAATLGQFVLHPARRRCLRILWNQIGTPEAPVDPKPADYPREFHAGFELYEFDADADPSQELNRLDWNGRKEPLGKWLAVAELQRRQQFELLPDELLLVTPSDTSDTQKWEAWYPSTVQRRKLAQLQNEPLVPEKGSNGKSHSEALYSSWFSWRESVLVWPNVEIELREPESPAPPASPLPTQRIWRKLITERSGRYVRTARLHPVLDHIISKTVESLDKEAEQGNKPKLATARSHTVELGPVTASPGKWSDFSAATNASVDPYAWSLLTRLGLATSFVIRDPQGKPLTAADLHAQLWPRIRETLAKPGCGEFQKHLHVELLYQPAKATRLARSESPQDQVGASVDVGDLLAVVQISLRPVLAQYAAYFRQVINLPKEPSPVFIKVKAPANQTVFVKIPEDPSLDVVKVEATIEIKITLARPASGRATLLFRSLRTDGQALTQPIVRIDDKDDNTVVPTNLVAFPATDPASRSFDADVNDLAQVVQTQPSYWETLRRLVEALNPAEVPPDHLKLPVLGSNDGSELPAWLQRLFDHGGNWALPTADATGPWLATAYLRNAPVMAIAPDPATGLLEYFHPVEDLYAHAWRYYIRPVGRYEQLWLGLGQSHTLFRDEDGNVANEQIAANLKSLTAFQPPPPGGLDLVLPRIRPISPPMILFSGRLDGPPPVSAAQLQPKPSGKTWQVVLAKHPEQVLVERNRTLARRLAYRQISVALLRRFQFAARTEPFGDADVTPEFPADGEILQGSQELFLKISDGAEQSLPLATNNMAGLQAALIKALTAAVPGQKFVVDRCNRLKPGSPPAPMSSLVVRSPKPLELTRRSPGSPGTDAPMLAKRQLAITRTTAATEPELPGPIQAIRRRDPLAEYAVDTIDELRELDLPPRLGRFGQGALVYQWQALPYYYEHLLLAVAQSTDVVSEISTTLQRELEYASPTPRAIVDTLLEMENNQEQRFRRVQIRLENFWNCLPADPSAQTRWPMEDPVTASPNDPRPRSAIPDPAVVYQLVLRRPGGVVQALSQVYFDPAVSHHYNVRNFPAKVGSLEIETVVLRRRPWGVDPGRPYEEYIETQLKTRGGPVIRALRAISSRHDVDGTRLRPATTGSAALVAPDRPLEFPQTATLALTQRLTHAEFTALESLLTREPRDNAFRIQSRRFLDRVREAHGSVEIKFEDEAALPTLDPDSELSFRPDGSATKHVLTWTGWRPEPAPLNRLRSLANGSDASVSRVVRGVLGQVLSRIDEDLTDVQEEMSIGLEQLTELADNPELAVIDERLKQVTWGFSDPTKPLSDGQRQVLTGFDDGQGNSVLGWVNIAPCAGTLRALLNALDSLTEAFKPTAADPATPTTGPLKDRVQIVAGTEGRLTWKQGGVTATQLAALQTWIDDAALGQSFRAAVSRLVARLTTVRLALEKSESTPTLGVGHPLESRLTIDKSGAVGLVTWHLGPINDTERAALNAIADQASGFGPTFRRAVSRLLTIGDKHAVQVGILETDFAPRPYPDDFTTASPSLGLKAGLARGAITVAEPMLSREEAALENACRIAWNRGPMRHLYNDSLRAGFEGGELQIQAFRGSAESRTSPIQPYLATQ